MPSSDCSTWLMKRIVDLSRNQLKLWVRDPDSLLELAEAKALEREINGGKKTFVVKHSLELRLDLASHDHLPVQWVVVDQSTPIDAKTGRPQGVFAPDLKHDLPDRSFRAFTIRDYLVDRTGDDSWPAEVNAFPYRELARYHPAEFLDAYHDFRQGSPRGFDTLDLKLIAAGTILEANLFNLSPLDLLRLSGKQSQKKWQMLSEFFNEKEITEVTGYLEQWPPPLGDLFGMTADTARFATLSLWLLSRQLPELVSKSSPDDLGSRLYAISPKLAQYRTVDPVPSAESARYPAWLADDFAETFDQVANISYVADLLELTDAAKARAFLDTNPPSQKLREVAQTRVALSGEPVVPEIAETRGVYQSDSLSAMIGEFTQSKRDIEIILKRAKLLTDELAVMPLSLQTIDQFTQGFQDGVYRIEVLIDRLSWCMRRIESNEDRKNIPGFVDEWQSQKKRVTDLQEEANRVVGDLDYRLARLLQARYSDVVSGKILQTWQVYEQFIVPRRRGSDGKPRRAAVVVFDGMRYDTWRELICPRLEKRYQIDEQIAMATLPSETRFSRKASFAGVEPGKIKNNSETYLFGEQLKRIHHDDPKLTAIEKDSTIPGFAFSFRSRDGRTYGVVFDFPDKYGHAFTWGLDFLMRTWDPILEEVDGWLGRLPPDTDVFVYSDHGHILPGTGRINLPPDACEDVNYRYAWLKKKIEGEKARHLVQIPSGDLGHAPGYYFAFPLPGYSFSLLNPVARFRPDEKYRHGGISMYEIFIPFAYLRLRTREWRVALELFTIDSYRAGQPGKIRAKIVADSAVMGNIELVSPTDGVAPAMAHDIGTVPCIVDLNFDPPQAGNVEIEVLAILGDKQVAKAKLSVYVEEAGRAVETPPDRILRMFRD